MTVIPYAAEKIKLGGQIPDISKAKCFQYFSLYYF